MPMRTLKEKLTVAAPVVGFRFPVKGAASVMMMAAWGPEPPRRKVGMDVAPLVIAPVVSSRSKVIVEPAGSTTAGGGPTVMDPATL
jgi:hypothetical protein